VCDTSYAELDPRLFSYNSKHGWCPDCVGTGVKLNKDHGAIQSKVMKRVVLKSTPVLRFHHDASAVRGVEIVNLLEEVDKLPKAPVEDEA
jgi:excinuclease UvrABC ATPase subunit